MIFNVLGHIDMIRNGTKTQTCRMKRSYYQIEAERKYPHEIGYAVQRKRGAKAEPDIRIAMDRIWEEDCKGSFLGVCISIEDAQAEGGYGFFEFEELFRELNPKWKRGQKRWAFKFHVIEVKE